jgi:hypothetical protein
MGGPTMGGGPGGGGMPGPMAGGPCGCGGRGMGMGGPGGPMPGGSDGALVEALRALTREIVALRKEVRSMKGHPPMPGTPGAPPAPGMSLGTFRFETVPGGEGGKPRVFVMDGKDGSSRVHPYPWGAEWADSLASKAQADKARAEAESLKKELEDLRAAMNEIRKKLEAPAPK